VFRYLALAEVVELHARVIEAAGGSAGLRDLGALESAVAQPRATFGGADLYPDLAAKAASLGFALISNHPFLDGNKRTGHAAMEVFLMLNGRELRAGVPDAEAVIVAVASGECTRERLASWVTDHVAPTEGN
jgi:death-on-curing protein